MLPLLLWPRHLRVIVEDLAVHIRQQHSVSMDAKSDESLLSAVRGRTGDGMISGSVLLGVNQSQRDVERYRGKKLPRNYLIHTWKL